MIEKPSTAKIALKWGAITGVALILFNTILYLSNATSNAGISSLIYVIVAAGLGLAMREFRQLDANYLSYGEGLGVGTLTGAVAGLISNMYSAIYITFIDPNLMKRVIDEMRDKLEEQGKMSDEQIDGLMENMQAFQSPGIQFITGLLWIVLVSFIFSLLIAAVLRRNKPVFE